MWYVSISLIKAYLIKMWLIGSICYLVNSRHADAVFETSGTTEKQHKWYSDRLRSGKGSGASRCQHHLYLYVYIVLLLTTNPRKVECAPEESPGTCRLHGTSGSRVPVVRMRQTHFRGGDLNAKFSFWVAEHVSINGQLLQWLWRHTLYES